MLVTDEKILRQLSKEWGGTKEELATLLNFMEREMTQQNGIGIAAIQIGKPFRVFLARLEAGLKAFVNPSILSLGSYKKGEWEGCLSMPDIQVRTKRSQSITLEYFDENLEKQKQTFKKFDAVIIQHELDHLNGKLCVDRGKVYAP